MCTHSESTRLSTPDGDGIFRPGLAPSDALSLEDRGSVSHFEALLGTHADSLLLCFTDLLQLF